MVTWTLGSEAEGDGRMREKPRSILFTPHKLLMTKVPHPRKYHREPCFIGGGNHLFIADRPARLYDAAGASCVIQPGGSIRDEEVIAAADEAGLAMVFTGMRHFRH